MNIYKNQVTTGRFVVPYRIYGTTGEAIVCVNGAQQTIASWRSFVSCMKDTYRVIAFDFPGHGRGKILSGLPAIPLQDQVHILHEVISAAGDSKQVNLAGASWGSIIVAMYAATYPARVKKAVMSGFGLTVNQKLSEMIKKGKKLAEENKKEELAGYLISEIGTQLPDTLKNAIVRQFKSMKEDHLLSFYSHSDFVNRTKQVDSIVNLKNIQAETLLIVGQNDTIVDKADVERAAEIIPNCKFMVLENAGHFLHFENKDIMKIYKDFYKRAD